MTLEEPCYIQIFIYFVSFIGLIYWTGCQKSIKDYNDSDNRNNHGG